MPFLSSLGNLLKVAFIIFQEGIDKFEIKNKTCFFFFFGVQYPLKDVYYVIHYVRKNRKFGT